LPKTTTIGEVRATILEIRERTKCSHAGVEFSYTTEHPEEPRRISYRVKEVFYDHLYYSESLFP